MTQNNPSWRNIPQQLTDPAITPIARQRRRGFWLRNTLTVLSLLAIVGGLGYLTYYLFTHNKTFAPYAQAQAKSQIDFFSDGQLNLQWFNALYPRLTNKGLLSIDIAALQSALLTHPQVLQATVERHFPNTLRVTLRERQPIARLKTKENGKPAIYYVARDGQLFSSPQYRAAPSLPYLAGLKLQQEGDHFKPIAGTELLADILQGLKDKFPELHLQINQIDLAEWIFPITPQTSVLVKTRQNTKLRFAPEQLPLQLSRLAEVIALLNTEKQTLSGKLIDMTYPDKVSVVGAP